MAKKLRGRWGQKFIDNRDWKTYNRQLVKRGEFLLDLEWVRSWDKELSDMNLGKVGHPYEFPQSLIRLQSIWHSLRIPLRMIAGVTLRLYAIAQLPRYNHYSTINRRINELDFSLELPIDGNYTIFCDGTGYQAVNGGEYLREKYGKKNRRWVQVIILGDPDTKEPVSMEVNIVQSSELESAKRQLNILKEHGTNVMAFGGDGGFDDIGFWRHLENERLVPIIKPDKNAREDSDSYLRNRNVSFRNKHGYNKWARMKQYGMRWPATEGIFSSIKRMFSEQLMARTEIGMVQEAKCKFWAYMTLKRYGTA